MIEVEMIPDTSRRGNYPAPAHSFALRLDDELALRLIERHHADEHYHRVDAERQHLGRWLAWAKGATPESVAGRIDGSLRRFEQGDGWRAELCWRSEPVGSLWLHGFDGVGGSTEVGYWLAAGHEGKGLMTRALRSLLRHFFEGRGLGRVSIGLDPRNERSMAVVERLALEPEAVLRRVQVDVDGALSDLAMFGLLREEWEARERLDGSGGLPVPRFCLEIDADDDLYLGLFERDDAAALAELVAANAEHLRPWLPWADDDDPDATLAFITGRALPAIANASGFEAGIWSRGRLVGAAGVHGVDARSRSGMLGYWLDAGEQGRGVVTRAVRAIVERCFSEKLFPEGPFERLEISAGVDNLRSRAVAERLGFTFEGVLRRQPLAGGSGRFSDLAIYGLLRGEWEALGYSVSATPAQRFATSTGGASPDHGAAKGGGVAQGGGATRAAGGAATMGASTRTEGMAMAHDHEDPGKFPQDERLRHDGDRARDTDAVRREGDQARDADPVRREGDRVPSREEAVDEALEESYPASDSPSHQVPRSEDEREEREEREADLDDALDDTFPASDPVSQTVPHRAQGQEEE